MLYDYLGEYNEVQRRHNKSSSCASDRTKRNTDEENIFCRKLSIKNSLIEHLRDNRNHKISFECNVQIFRCLDHQKKIDWRVA